jgi:hypothetical protein
MGHFRKVSATEHEWWNGRHRFEHWYRDNTVYFLTSRVSDRSPVFLVPDAAEVFWDRWDHWAAAFDVRPLVVTLMSNHYHAVARALEPGAIPIDLPDARYQRPHPR